MPIQVVVLGSGSAVPTLQRNPSAHWLRIHDCDMLIDCGEGTQLQMTRLQLRSAKLRAIFISHLHGDHYLGLPGLISSMHLMGRKAPLQLFGPPPLIELLEQQFKASESIINFPIEFNPLFADEPRYIGAFEHFTVQSFPLNHRIACTGFRFDEKPGLRNIRKDAIKQYQLPVEQLHGIRQGNDFITPSGKRIPNKEITKASKHLASYAYCSDTRPDPAYIQTIQQVDCLYHEATFAENLVGRARDTFHSTAAEAALTALTARAGHLLIGHFSARYRDVAPLLAEAREIFPNTHAAIDGMALEIHSDKHLIIS